jgi:hypothetical protein
MGSSKPKRDRKAERAMEIQREKQQLRLAEADSDIARKKAMGSGRLGGRSLLQANVGGSRGLPTKLSGEGGV